MNTLYRILLCIAILAVAQKSSAMPGTAHRSLDDLLLQTAPEAGGCRGMTKEAMESTDNWMDYFSKRFGSWHDRVRHNPPATARVLSGNGTQDLARLNRARLHKIQDVFANTRPVDGWPLTPDLKAEAKRILAHVEKHGGLPKDLPRWVDDPGPLRTVARSADDAARGTGRALTRNGDDAARSMGQTVSRSADDIARSSDEVAHVLVKTAKGVQKVAVPLAIAVQVGLAGHAVYSTEADYAAGRITAIERGRRHCQIGSTTAGGVGGAWIGGALGSFGGPPGTIVGVIVGSVAGDWLAGKVSDVSWELYAREAAARDRIRFAADAHIIETSGELSLTIDDYREIGILTVTDQP